MTIMNNINCIRSIHSVIASLACGILLVACTSGADSHVTAIPFKQERIQTEQQLIHALITNDLDTARALVTDEVWPVVHMWMLQRKPVTCRIFLNEVNGMGVVLWQDDSVYVMDDYWHQETKCRQEQGAAAFGEYILSIDHIRMERRPSGWIVTELDGISESR